MKTSLCKIFRRWSNVVIVPALVVFCMFSASTAFADTILDAWSPYSPSSSIYVNTGTQSINLGDVFKPNVTGTVIALGIYAGNNASYVNPEPVALYSSTGTLLASTTVTDTSYLYDGYYWTYLITPVSIVSGNVYTVDVYLNGDGWGYGPAPVNNGATFVSHDYISDVGLSFPTTNGSAGAAYYGGNVMFDEPPPSGIPEPGTLLLFGSGLLGMAGVLRRKFNRI
jgi:hypothetical protein